MRSCDDPGKTDEPSEPFLSAHTLRLFIAMGDTMLRRTDEGIAQSDLQGPANITKCLLSRWNLSGK